MGLRTYLPLLRVIAHRLCSYIREHRDKIDEFIGEENVDAVSAALLACDVLCDILDTVIVEGS